MSARFIQNPIDLNWVILNPRRSSRPDQNSGKKKKVVCPFEPGNEEMAPEVARVGGNKKTDWQVRVVKNIFPITPIHEVIIHSPEHKSSFTDLSLEQIKLIFKVYQDRYMAHLSKGYPLIFHNHGGQAGESLHHGHSQLAVIPAHIGVHSPLAQKPHNVALKGKSLVAFCPDFSTWPFETWIQPFTHGKHFGQVDVDQLNELAAMVQRILKAINAAHPDEPYNFYIYPGEDWYLRILGRNTTPAGFELGAGITVNTMDPKDVVKVLS